MKLKKCLMLLPTAYNDGTAVSPAVMSEALMSVDRAFDGMTVGGPVEGTYTMADGTTARDKSIVVWVNVDPSQVGAVKGIAARIAGVLKQETLYFEVTDIDAELVRPIPQKGEEP